MAPPIQSLIADFLAHAMEQGTLRTALPSLATSDLLALLEAELAQRFVFQHLPLPTEEEIDAFSDRAVQAFLQLYAPAPTATRNESTGLAQSLR